MGTRTSNTAKPKIRGMGNTNSEVGYSMVSVNFLLTDLFSRLICKSSTNLFSHL